MGFLMDAVCSTSHLRESYPTMIIATAVVSFAFFFLWLRWLYSLVFSMDIIKTCCGRTAERKLSGYDSLLPDAELIPEAKDRDNTIIVYVAKEIVTMDPTWPTAKVVACQYGRILGVGQSIQDLDPWLTRRGLDPDKDVIIDRTFEDRVIVPGFIEQHGHPMIGGTAMSLICVAFHDTVAPYGPMIKGCKSKPDVIDRLKKEHKERPLTDGLGAEEFLMAWGYDSVVMGGHLTKEDLDVIDPEGIRCVFVWDCSMHFGYCNTTMLEKKIGMEVKNGKIYNAIDGVEIDPKTGELTGAFLGIPALHTYCKCIVAPLMKPSRSLQSMHHMTEIARMGGITTVCEMLMGNLNIGMELDLYKWFYENEITPCRCVCIIDADKVKKYMSPFRIPLPNARANAAALWIRDQQLNSSEKLIFNNGVKFFADDSFLGLTMQLGFPGYVEPHKRKGIWSTPSGPGAAFCEEILPFWKAGCRIHVHSNGEASQDAMSEVVQMLQTIRPRFDHRFCLEHYGMSASHIHRRLKNLGVNVSVNVYYALLRGQINEAHLGKDKAHAASRLKSIVDSGLVVAMHADTPVAPPRPLEEMWFACNRMADKLTTLPSSKTCSNGTSKGNTKMNGHDNGYTNPKTKAMKEITNGNTKMNGHSNGYANPATKAMNANMNGITNTNGHSNGHLNPTTKAMNANSNATSTNGNANGHANPNTSSNLVSICPSERVSPYQAMRMKTIDAAYVHGLDGVIGSIETGKFADFTILAQNPLESDKTRLKDIKVIATVIGGVKRMNVPQKRRVPVPPGDHFLGQVFWMKAMIIVETGMLSSFRRWMLLTIAAYFGSTGTLEDALLVAKEKALYEISKSSTTKKKKRFDTNAIFGAGWCCIPVSEDEILPSIKSRHVKPTSSMSNFRCC